MTIDDEVPVPPAAVTWQSSPIYVVWSDDGSIRQASESYAALVGIPLGDLIGRKWPDLVEAEAELSWQQFRFSLQTLSAAPVVVADMPTNSSGELRWLRWTEWAVRDESGALSEVHSTAIDVTELHEAREALSSVIETLLAARNEGRREVVEQLHNGAVQQLVAARWALTTGEVDAARALVDDALGAVRSSMDSLDAPTPPPLPTPDPAPLWHKVPGALRDAPLPDDVRELVSASLVDPVAVLSSTGAVWLAPSARMALFDDATDVDVAMLLAAVHREDRDHVAQCVLGALDGEQQRCTWRYRHPARGWRRLTSLLMPLPQVARGPKLALVLSLDITDDLESVRTDRMEVQLAERERIARDLHDDALQQLTGLRWMLTSRGADAEVLEELQAVDDAIRTQLAALHSVVARFGLAPALRQLLQQLTTPVASEWPDEIDELPIDVAEVVFRSAREALRNVDQHARATSATMSIEIEPSKVVLNVLDDGVGVDPRLLATASSAGHLGVSTMRETALAAGGRFELAPRASGGTRLRLELPLG